MEVKTPSYINPASSASKRPASSFKPMTNSRGQYTSVQSSTIQTSLITLNKMTVESPPPENKRKLSATQNCEECYSSPPLENETSLVAGSETAFSRNIADATLEVDGELYYLHKNRLLTFEEAAHIYDMLRKSSSERAHGEFWNEHEIFLLNWVIVNCASQFQKKVTHFTTHDWALISTLIPGRSPSDCRERWEGITTGWSRSDDDMLAQLAENLGPNRWHGVAKFFNLGREAEKQRSAEECEKRWKGRNSPVLVAQQSMGSETAERLNTTCPEIPEEFLEFDRNSVPLPEPINILTHRNNNHNTNSNAKVNAEPKINKLKIPAEPSLLLSGNSEIEGEQFSRRNPNVSFTGANGEKLARFFYTQQQFH